MYIARYEERPDVFTIKWWEHPTPATASEFKEHSLTGALIGRPQWLLDAVDASKLAGTMYDCGANDPDSGRWVAWVLFTKNMVIAQCLRMDEGFAVEQMEFPDM